MIQEQDLCTLRKRLGLSQEKMAEKLGVSRNTISRWERGSFKPSAENLTMLNKLYAELESPAAPQGEANAPAPDIPAKQKKWLMTVVCIGVLCSLLIGIISLIGIYSIHQRLEPEDTVVPVEEIEKKEVNPSSFVSGTLQPLQP